MAGLLLLGSAAFGNVYRVRNNHDSGQYSLRWAITEANNHSGRDKIVFAARLAGRTILVNSVLPTLSDNRTVIDGDIDGDGDPDVVVNGKRLSSGNGLTVSGNYCTIRGLAVVSFPGSGILVDHATGCRVFGCHVGVNLAGTTRRAHGQGDIFIHDGISCQVGGAAPWQRNVIAGATDIYGAYFGVRLAGAKDSQVANNLIGVARDGTTAFGGYGHGIELGFGQGDIPTGNTIGGSRTLGEGNILGGMSHGIDVTAADDNVIAGNNLGLGADGDTALPLTLGVRVYGHCRRNVIGGTSPEFRNVFAGNANIGVLFSTVAAYDNKVQGNYFGTNVAGNKQRRLASGVVVDVDAGAQTIGGNTAPAGNYFALKSADKQYGVYLDGAGEDSLIRHNRFGLRPDGTTGLNYGTAVYVRNVKAEVTDNTIANANAGVTVLDASGRARILRNRFRSCYVAVNLGPTAHAFLGNLGNSSTRDDGGNIFRASNTWHIWNFTPNRIMAEGNSFGTTSRAAIDAKIHDRRDDSSKGRVDFNPLMGGVIPSGDVVPLAVASATALPTAAGGAEIAFTLSAPAAVTIDVLNIAGRPVATVVHDRAADAGTQRLVWSGQSAHGTRAPAGKYLVRITARIADGEQRTALCGVTLP